MSTQRQEKMEQMFDGLCDALIAKMKADPTAADLNVVRQLLKDNGIEAVPATGTPLQILRDTLPFASTNVEGDGEAAVG